MKKKLIEGDFEDRTAYETENEIIICGDPDEVDDHNCDEMGCTSISHVVYRFRKTLRQEVEDITEEKELWRKVAGERGLEVEALKAENKTLRKKNDNWLEICEALKAERDRLREALKPFADGYERAKFKSAWASSYTHADAYKNAYKVINHKEHGE